ncbi:MAG: hypothetical protein EON58_00930 [Alphaproteobacteria bacterium]|nr:MAG: hypothetical protein EON58_00930 [Alphaproteobacteria bacterium]
MRRLMQRTLIVSTALFIWINPDIAAAQTTTSCSSSPIRTDALDNPSKHAWAWFLTVMQPAKPITVARGEPDCSTAVGTPGTTSLWETWRLARTEVFLEDGSEPPAWDDTSRYYGHLGAVPEDERSVHERPSQATILIDEETRESVFQNRGGIGETRMNRSTYEFIKENCLFSFDGLSRYSKAVVDGKKPPIIFPTDSVEVKAVWIEFSPSDISKNRHLNYYTAKIDQTTYGLASFHLLTKDVPNWFWATFHHVDSPPNEFELPDTFGRPKQLDGTIWQNYVLGGTQTDFTDPTGQPSILSDTRIEFSFLRSSCITCHASAKGHPEPRRNSDGTLARNSRGTIIASLEGPLQTTDVGLPDAASFRKDDKMFYIQTDFLWSIPFRANEEKSPPPKRCQF